MAQVSQHASWGEKRATQGPQTWWAGQLWHTAHWLARAGHRRGRVKEDLKRLWDTTQYTRVPNPATAFPHT